MMKLQHPSAPSTAAGRRQRPLVFSGVGSVPDRPCRSLSRPRAPQQGHPGRNVQVQVIEQSKSSAETYIESLQQSLQDQRQQEPQEDSSIVVSDISELKQKVATLETQVRIKGCMGVSRGLQSLSFGSKIVIAGQWARQLLMIQSTHDSHAPQQWCGMHAGWLQPACGCHKLVLVET